MLVLCRQQRSRSMQGCRTQATVMRRQCNEEGHRALHSDTQPLVHPMRLAAWKGGWCSGPASS